MRDIRLISGKNITPDFTVVSKLLGCKSEMPVQSRTELERLYEQLLPQIKMHIRPKAALAISTFDEEKQLLYVMLTLGEGISRLMEKQMQREDLLSAMVTDAMADSCLFAFEEQLLPVIRQIALTEGYGIKKRLEIPEDLPIETQKKAYDSLDAERTLGLSMTSGYMLEPVKSMSLVFELTTDKNSSCQNLHHDCENCKNINCNLRTEKTVVLQVESNASQGVERISCAKGSNLLDILRENKIFLPVCCGGNGTCGKCGVLLKEGRLPITIEDQKLFSEAELKRGMRLSCKVVLQENISIALMDSSETSMKALGSSDVWDMAEYASQGDSKQYLENDYGIAIDIGTTTLAMSLVQLQSGKIIDTYTGVNRQRTFGADVISRIQASNAGNREQLSRLIKEDLLAGILDLMDRNTGDLRISHIVIAGNTVMLHLLRDYSCEGLSSYPFTPVTLEMEELSFTDLFGEIVKTDTKIILLPGISAFVGADITAGLYACDIPKSTKNCLFLDLGTNGEMALKTKTDIYTASTAAGPAFEGGNIKWGMGSIAGAISKATMAQGKIEVGVIGDLPPKGICGTGVIEIIAELLESEIIDANGKLAEPYFKDGYPLAKTARGETIVLTQQDIRELQMAKAAIRAGIEVLLLRAKITYEEIEQVYLAGGFGYFLDVKKAARIGILPKEWEGRTILAGNTSLKGAIRFLLETTNTKTQNDRKLGEIARNTKEVILAKDGDFEDLYIKNIMFF